MLSLHHRFRSALFPSASQLAYARNTATWSDDTPDRFAHRFLFSSPFARSSARDTNGDRTDNAAETTSASSHAPKMVPNKISFPRRASIGSADRCIPSGVRSSRFVAVCGVIASNNTSSSTALFTASTAGGSNRRAHTSAADVPRCRYTGSARIRSTSCSSATLRTSGS
eukprot:31379-Pelagococcus_subviridis.AAC.24